jgi:transcriptional regulator with GAF, ATPase, and Fis domain
MRKIFRIVEKVANSNTTIMLNGETGTGKGLIARAIHKASGRKDQPFIQINCGATPEGLLESEFFGYRRGAFTGATADKAGKFEIAQGGTIFLDEIGDMSADLQVKVLRVLEEGEFERVGGNETIKTDARIIAATHRDLEEEVQKGNFREDLFYRLYVIPIMLPTLKEICRQKGCVPGEVFRRCHGYSGELRLAGQCARVEKPDRETGRFA